MNHKQYKAVTPNDMKTKKYRLTEEVHLGGGHIIAKGTIVTLDLKRAGFNITTERCPHCGVRLHCRKVPYAFVEEVVT